MFAHFANRDEVRMLHARRRRRLRAKAAHHFRRREFTADNCLQRDMRPARERLCAINDAHSAAAKFLDEFV